MVWRVYKVPAAIEVPIILKNSWLLLYMLRALLPYILDCLSFSSPAFFSSFVNFLHIQSSLMVYTLRFAVYHTMNELTYLRMTTVLCHSILKSLFEQSSLVEWAIPRPGLPHSSHRHLHFSMILGYIPCMKQIKKVSMGGKLVPYNLCKPF